MSVTDCPNCGEPVAAFAKTCAHCGAANKARRASFVIAASLLLLLVAAGAAIFAVVRWQRLPSTEKQLYHKQEKCLAHKKHWRSQPNIKFPLP